MMKLVVTVSFFETPQCKDTVYKDDKICEDFRD